jgi:hypothetical protein
VTTGPRYVVLATVHATRVLALGRVDVGLTGLHILDPSEHFVGGEVLRSFSPRNAAGLQLCRVEKSWYLWCHIPGSLSWEPVTNTLGARV